MLPTMLKKATKTLRRRTGISDPPSPTSSEHDLAMITHRTCQNRRLNPPIETIHPVSAAQARVVLFDFDGSLSLIRTGWFEVMVPMMAEPLDVSRYFHGVHGALDDYKSFSKRILIERILATPGIRGEQLLGFGDGYVEIEEVKQAGGVTVGVATDEPECLVVDEWKRQRLIRAGADYIIPNYLCGVELMARLFGGVGCSRYEIFDRSRLEVKPLAERAHDLHLDRWLALGDPAPPFAHPDLPAVAERLKQARAQGSARILMMGAHVIRAGVNRHIIDMVERGWIDHIAMNGAGTIHDYELARIGATTESVDRYIRTGEFGLWRETGELNDW